MQSNQLTSLPESVGSLVDLDELLINRNKLTTLPESICKLVHLKRLEMKENELSSLPDKFGKLTDIIDLSGNNIKSLPLSINKKRASMIFSIKFSDSTHSKVIGKKQLAKKLHKNVNYSNFNIEWR